MKLAKLIIGSLLLLSITAIAENCYSVYSSSNELIFESRTSPVDMRNPSIGPEVSAKFPGSSLVFRNSDVCREITPEGIAKAKAEAIKAEAAQREHNAKEKADAKAAKEAAERKKREAAEREILEAAERNKREPVEKEESAPDKDSELAIQAVVRSFLKDPDSAKFGKLVVINSTKVCIPVNSKNSYGGYTGEKYFPFKKGERGQWVADGSSSNQEFNDNICRLNMMTR
jgi:predicted nucleic acid binding AN1-type Zn finger protein